MIPMSRRLTTGNAALPPTVVKSQFELWVQDFSIIYPKKQSKRTKNFK
jgi:hypothetical protein